MTHEIKLQWFKFIALTPPKIAYFVTVIILIVFRAILLNLLIWNAREALNLRFEKPTYHLSVMLGFSPAQRNIALRIDLKFYNGLGLTLIDFYLMNHDFRSLSNSF